MSVNIGSLALILKGDMSPLAADLRAAGRMISNFGKSIPGLLGSGAGGLFGAAAGKAGGLISGLSGGVMGIAKDLLGPGSIMSTIKELAGEAKMASSVGMGIEQFTGLAHAAHMSGVSTEEFTHFLKHMQRGLGEANLAAEQGSAKLEQFGIDSRKVAEMGDQAIFFLADEYLKLGPAVDKAAFAMAAGGRGAQNMIPFLEKGSAGLRKMAEEGKLFGMVMNAAQAQEIVKAKTAVLEMETAFTGMKRQLAIDFAPLVSSIAGGFKDWLKSIGGVPALAHKIATFFYELLENITSFLVNVGSVTVNGKELFNTDGLVEFHAKLIRSQVAMDKLFKTAQKPGPGGIFTSLINQVRQLGENFAHVGRTIDGAMLKLKEEVETFGMGDIDKKIFELTKAAGADHPINQKRLVDLKELDNQLIQLKKGEEDWQKAAHLADSLKGPADKFKDAIREADNLREDVKLSENEWIRARGKAAMDLASQFGPQGLPTAILQGSAEALSAVNRAQSASDKNQNPFKQAEEILKRLEEIDRQMLTTLKQQLADAQVFNRPGIFQ